MCIRDSSHSAVSRHIKLLEEHLGVLLFERRVRQSVLTPAGQRFYEQVSAGLARIANAAAELKQHASLPTVKINVRPSFAMLWLAPRLEDFIAQHPGIKPQVMTQTQAPDHSRDGFDIVIRRGRDDWAPAIEALDQRGCRDQQQFVFKEGSCLNRRHPVVTPTANDDVKPVARMIGCLGLGHHLRFDVRVLRDEILQSGR